MNKVTSQNVIARSETTKQSLSLLKKQDCFAALAMTSRLFKQYWYMIIVVCVIVLIMSGCNEPQTTSGKQSRLIAAENMKLKKEIEQLNIQIEELKEQEQKEIEYQKNLLVDAQKEIETWKEKSKQNVHDQVQGVLDIVIAENSDLRKEIEELKSELENQRKQVSALEKMLKEKPGY